VFVGISRVYSSRLFFVFSSELIFCNSPTRVVYLEPFPSFFSSSLFFPEQWVAEATEKGLDEVVGSFMLASKGVIRVPLLETNRQL